MKLRALAKINLGLDVLGRRADGYHELRMIMQTGYNIQCTKVRSGGFCMKLRALAKINLGLDVLGRRADGYHELRMIMQTINMYDQLDMEISEEPGIKITFLAGGQMDTMNFV